MSASSIASRTIFGLGGALLAFMTATHAVAGPPAATAEEPLPAEAGVWFDDTGEGAVEIKPCGRYLLCGRIVWLKDPLNAEGVPKHDRYNPDPSLRNRLICGLPVLANLQKMTNGTYDNGVVYDPKKGDQHDAAIRLVRPDQLELTGFGLGRLLSKSFIWTRAPADLPLCTGNGNGGGNGTSAGAAGSAPKATAADPKAAPAATQKPVAQQKPASGGNASAPSGSMPKLTGDAKAAAPAAKPKPAPAQVAEPE